MHPFVYITLGSLNATAAGAIIATWNPLLMKSSRSMKVLGILLILLNLVLSIYNFSKAL